MHEPKIQLQVFLIVCASWILSGFSFFSSSWSREKWGDFFFFLNCPDFSFASFTRVAWSVYWLSSSSSFLKHNFMQHARWNGFSCFVHCTWNVCVYFLYFKFSIYFNYIIFMCIMLNVWKEKKLTNPAESQSRSSNQNQLPHYFYLNKYMLLQ